MPTLGYVIRQNGVYQGVKTKAYGGDSGMFASFDEAKQFVNGSVGVRAKIREVTKAGAAGAHGGPTTHELYLPD